MLSWEALLRYAAVPLLTSLLVGWLGASRSRVRSTEEARRLRQPRITLVVGIAVFALFASFAILSVVFIDGTGALVATTTFAAFAVLALWIVLDYARGQHQLTPEGLSYGKPLGPRGSLRWRDVTSLSYSPGMKWFRIETASGQVVRLSAMLMGLPEFARAALAQVPGYAIEQPRTLAVLQATARGELPQLGG